ncbi:phytase [Verrucomicrobiota bacterium sgz303538]
MFLTNWYRVALLASLPVTPLCSALANNITGPSSSESPYVLRSQPGVTTTSILTVGDAVNYKSDGVTPYRMAGIPDGLGAFDNGDGTFTLLMNHEMGAGTGAVRGHGFNGGFISKWVIEKETLTVLHGEDLIKSAYTWNSTTQAYQPATGAFSRFCSGDLAPISGFYNATTGLGYNGRIYLNGEENGTEGRAFAHFLDGNSYELPRLGKASWENSVAHPNTGDKTVVVCLDDSGAGQIYFYVGDKTTSPDRVAAAGLSNGTLFSVKLNGISAESDATVVAPGTPFTGVNLGDVSSKSGVELENNSKALGVTAFNRPEDGAWDPTHPNDFYFVTTASFTGKSRLWRLRFVDPSNPALGGTADVLLDSSRGPRMMDNMTISKRGSIFIQEDVGNNVHLGKIWRYSIARGTLELVAEHDSQRFLAGGSNFLTQDEESSGIIPMDEILGEGWYLFDVQAHYKLSGELVEGGQLLGLHFPPGREK